MEKIRFSVASMSLARQASRILLVILLVSTTFASAIPAKAQDPAWLETNAYTPECTKVPETEFLEGMGVAGGGMWGPVAVVAGYAVGAVALLGLAADIVAHRFIADNVVHCDKDSHIRVVEAALDSSNRRFRVYDGDRKGASDSFEDYRHAVDFADALAKAKSQGRSAQ